MNDEKTSTLTKNTFQCERAQDCFDEAYPLLFDHWKSIGHYQDILLEPAFDEYKRIEDAGLIRCFTVRTEFKKLIGYAVFVVRNNMHYRSSKNALLDIIYIDPAYRGIGKDFISWCDEELRGEQVQVVFHHLKAAHSYGKMLERMGYELMDLIYAKRLDI